MTHGGPTPRRAVLELDLQVRRDMLESATDWRDEQAAEARASEREELAELEQFKRAA